MQNLKPANLLADPVNLRILKALSANPRLPNAELARGVGMSGPRRSRARAAPRRGRRDPRRQARSRSKSPRLSGGGDGAGAPGPRPAATRSSNWRAPRRASSSVIASPARTASSCGCTWRASRRSTGYWMRSCFTGRPDVDHPILAGSAAIAAVAERGRRGVRSSSRTSPAELKTAVGERSAPAAATPRPQAAGKAAHKTPGFPRGPRRRAARRRRGAPCEIPGASSCRRFYGAFLNIRIGAPARGLR